MSLHRALALFAASAAAHVAVLGVFAASPPSGPSVLVVDLAAEEQRPAIEPEARPAPAPSRPARSDSARPARPSRSLAPAAPGVVTLPPSEEPRAGGEPPPVKTLARTEPIPASVATEPSRRSEPRLTVASDPRPEPNASAPPRAAAQSGERGAEVPATAPAPGLAQPSMAPGGGAGARSVTEGGASARAASDPAGGESGSRLALARPGGVRDGVPAEYAVYLAQFRQRVQESLGYPLTARRRGLSGTVEIDVMIDAAGRVRDVQVSSSSSHAILDEAAVEAVRRMAPLPFPEHVPARPLRVRLPLVFELR